MRKLSMLLLICSCLAYAGGYQLYSESAADVLGAGGAAVARAGHASVAWYNPAASVTLDRMTISAGGSMIRLDGKYTGANQLDHLDDQPRWTGYFYGVVPISEPARFSLSVNAPYGMITQWSAHSELRDLATFTSIRACYISPGLSYRLTDNFAVAAGMNAVIGVARLAKYITPLKNKLYMRADDISAGGFFSCFWEVNDDWNAGLHYQSKVKLDLTGDANYRWRSSGPYVFRKDDVGTSIELPAYLALGIENHTLENWRFMADAVWTEWSSYKAMNIWFDSYPAYGDRRTASNYRGWHDTWSYRLGVEYDLNEYWTLRCGYMYDVSPANRRTISPEMPDSDKQLFSLGVGYQGEHWGFDASYAYIYFAQCHLGRQVAELNKAYRGTFDMNCQVLSFQMNYRF